MPTLSFFAAQPDRDILTAFLLSDLRLTAFEAYSRYDRPLRTLQSPSDIACAYPALDTGDEPARALHLALWRADLGPRPAPRRIQLKPGAVPGSSFWYSMEGWGLLYLQISHAQEDRLRVASLSVNSEARARNWEATTQDRHGAVAAWNWPAIAQTYGKIRYHIARRLAVGKQEGRPILHAAAALSRDGLRLVEV